MRDMLSLRCSDRAHARSGGAADGLHHGTAAPGGERRRKPDRSGRQDSSSVREARRPFGTGSTRAGGAGYRCTRCARTGYRRAAGAQPVRGLVRRCASS
jgi:hypothetical protein